MNQQETSRRDFLKILGAVAMASQLPEALEERRAEAQKDIEAADRVFIANEDSNTITVIDPRSNRVETTINLTSFDEDPRPPFCLVTGGLMPTHAAMIHKPLYHGCIDAHGVVPSPDGRMLATSGCGSSNIYLIDSVNKKVIGNMPNPFASATTNAERISSGILVGREPHEPTFTGNGKELWVAVRGEDRIAILAVERAVKQSGGADAQAILTYVATINGPAQV
jgi:YVTN family beta-propeller protein